MSNEASAERFFETRNTLDSSVRADATELLNQSLADTTDLLTQTKYAHWNVKGPQFRMLHELFDEQAALLFEHADRIAERATALGGTATGTTRMAAASSRLDEFPTDAVNGVAVVGALADRYADHATYLRENIDTALDAGDAETSDLYTELARDVEKQLWFLEAHHQGGESVDRPRPTLERQD